MDNGKEVNSVEEMFFLLFVKENNKMWFKIKNELINLNGVGSFTYDITTLQIKITFISGEKRTYNYNSWPEFNSIKNSIDEMIDKHMFEAEENRKALEEEQKIQEMLETLQKVYRVGGRQRRMIYLMVAA